MKDNINYSFGRHLTLRLKYYKSRWFPNKIQRKREQFYSSFINKNDLCFDVGANIGNRISPLLAIGAKVVAVEPQESCINTLRLKFGNKIELITNGLGEREGIENFHISNIDTISSFSDEWINSVKDDRFKEFNWDKQVKVEMTTLDKLIEQYGLPQFIKIDVEGYELNVLKGLSKPINVISFEYTVPEQTDKIIECIEQIERNDLNIECNYSIGESMDFLYHEWKSVSEMKEHVHSQEFIDTHFGDVYVRMKSFDER